MKTVIAILVGIVVNELWDLSSAPARRIVRIAARWWARSPDEAEIYAEEWCAYIDDRPGRLLKLATALGLLGAATYRAGCRQINRRLVQREKVAFVQRPWLVASRQRLGSLFKSETARLWYLVISLAATAIGSGVTAAALDSRWGLRVLILGYCFVGLGLMWMVAAMVTHIWRETRYTREFRHRLDSWSSPDTWEFENLSWYPPEFLVPSVGAWPAESAQLPLVRPYVYSTWCPWSPEQVVAPLIRPYIHQLAVADAHPAVGRCAPAHRAGR